MASEWQVDAKITWRPELFPEGDHGDQDGFYKVENGEVKYADQELKRRVDSATMTWIKELEGQDINKLENVARVNQLFPEEWYNKLFPYR